MALGSRSPWGYLGKNKNSFRHGSGESESLGILGEEQKFNDIKDDACCPKLLVDWLSLALGDKHQPFIVLQLATVRP
jgi:hypothetical protein